MTSKVIPVDQDNAINTEIRRESLKGRFGSFGFEGKPCFGVKKPVLLKDHLRLTKGNDSNPEGTFIENPFENDSQYRNFLQDVVIHEIQAANKGLEIIVFVPGVPEPTKQEFSFRITIIGMDRPGPLAEESQQEKFYSNLGEIYMMIRKYTRAHARDVAFDPSNF